MKNSLAENASGNPDPVSSPAFHLAGDETQIWCESLERPSQIVTRLSALLSPDEKVRADRFYFARDRVHFIVGRGLLRTILGGYLRMDPARIEFIYGLHGKPALKMNYADWALQFNLAHSKDLVVYAFRQNFPIGIDIEHVREIPNEDAFAEQIFSSSESALLRSLAGEQKRKAFFTIWTCKEAFLKANGEGLTKPIDQTEISLGAGEAPQLVSIGGDRGQVAGWRLETFQPVPDYQGALALEGHNCKIVFKQAGNYFA